MKKYFSMLIILVIFCLAFSTNISGHSNHVDIQYDDCSKEENVAGENERWYNIDDLDANVANISSHLKHNTPVIYYFSPTDEDDPSQTWSTYIQAVWQEKGYYLTSEEIDNIESEIKNIFIASMEKWNAVYYYPNNNDETQNPEKLVDIIQGDENNCNVII